MNAPWPSLMEQATIDRLGVFEDEKFAEIVERFNSPPICGGIDCDAPATLRVLCAHCSIYIDVTCGDCEDFRQRFGRKRRFKCTAGCGAVTVGWAVATRTVPL